MAFASARRSPFALIALLLLVGLLEGRAITEQKGASLEPLLTVSDLGKTGLTGVVLAPPDAHDRTEQLGFVRASDSWLVLNLSRFDVNSLGGGTLRAAVGIVSADDVVSVSGVGDEAYSFLEGLLLVFRKGSVTLQLSSGVDSLREGKPFLTREQLVEIAKIVCSRL